MKFSKDLGDVFGFGLDCRCYLNDDEGRDKNDKLAVVSKQHPPKSVICLGDIGNVMLYLGWVAEGMRRVCSQIESKSFPEF